MMSEEKRIMDYFGFGQIEGDIRGEHFSKILAFLKMNDGQSWDFIKEVSPLVIHMQFRYIKENYVQGLIRLGVIRLYADGNIYKYRWIGEKALDGIMVLPVKKEQVEPKRKTKKGYCPSCGKKLKKNQAYCSEECLRKHLKEKKEKRD